MGRSGGGSTVSQWPDERRGFGWFLIVKDSIPCQSWHWPAFVLESQLRQLSGPSVSDDDFTALVAAWNIQVARHFLLLLFAL